MITPAEYAFFQQLLRARSGLVLGDGKHYLLESRLLPVASKHGIPTISALAAKLRIPGNAAIEREVVDAMATNESFFFRDKTPFDMFASVMLPAMVKRRPATQPIRIWCAAASSGQEPYSIAMLLRENAATCAGRRFEIVATDISDAMLTRAKGGIYTQFEVQRGLPVQLLLKYFRKDGENWQLTQEIRNMVDLRNVNLLQPLNGIGTFDIVFCRNVLIYFDMQTKNDVLSRIAKTMRPDGFLVLGGAETVVGVTNAFTPVPEQRSLYTPAAAGAAPSPFVKASVVAA